MKKASPFAFIGKSSRQQQEMQSVPAAMLYGGMSARAQEEGDLNVFVLAFDTMKEA